MHCKSLFSDSASSPVKQFQTSSEIQANRTACFHAGKSSAVRKVGTFTNDLSIRKYEEKAEAPQSTNITKKRLPKDAMHTVRPPTSCKVKTQKQGVTLEVSRGSEAKEQVLVSRKSLGADVAENGTCTPTLMDETEVKAKEG